MTAALGEEATDNLLFTIRDVQQAWLHSGRCLAHARRLGRRSSPELDSVLAAATDVGRTAGHLALLATDGGSQTAFVDLPLERGYVARHGTLAGYAAFHDDVRDVLDAYVRLLCRWRRVLRDEIRAGGGGGGGDADRLLRECEREVAREHGLIAQKFRAVADGALGIELMLEPPLEIPAGGAQRDGPATSQCPFRAALERALSRGDSAMPSYRATAHGAAPSAVGGNRVEPTPPPSRIRLLDPPPEIPPDMYAHLAPQPLRIFDHRRCGVQRGEDHYTYRLVDYIRRSLMFPENAAKYAILIRANRKRYAEGYGSVLEMLEREASPSVAEGEQTTRASGALPLTLLFFSGRQCTAP